MTHSPSIIRPDALSTKVQKPIRLINAYSRSKTWELQKDIADFAYNTYAKIAAAFIENNPTCHVHYGFDLDYHQYVLYLEYTGLYLRDLRCWLPDNMTLKYGNTQDTIIVIDKNHA